MFNLPRFHAVAFNAGMMGSLVPKAGLLRTGLRLRMRGEPLGEADLGTMEADMPRGNPGHLSIFGKAPKCYM